MTMKLDKFTWQKKLRGADLTKTEYCVLMNISTYTGPDLKGATMSVATIASDCRIDARWAQRNIKSLQQKGFLKITTPGGNAPGNTNTYEVTLPSQIGVVTMTTQPERAPEKASEKASEHVRGESVGLGSQVGVEAKDKQAALNKKTKAVATTLPADFEVSESMWDWARGKGLETLVDRETVKFRNYHEAKGTKNVNWEPAWKNWIINAQEYAKKEKAPAARPADWF